MFPLDQLQPRHHVQEIKPASYPGHSEQRLDDNLHSEEGERCKILMVYNSPRPTPSQPLHLSRCLSEGGCYSSPSTIILTYDRLTLQWPAESGIHGQRLSDWRSGVWWSQWWPCGLLEEPCSRQHRCLWGVVMQACEKEGGREREMEGGREKERETSMSKIYTSPHTHST